ncbi:MAG: gamma-butyrobetaine hydroxylase-like domain-containing protein, partial [Pseudomonadales bacterium]|nr:gamma-butyrobetaine hydroxylase-like domain-containing protein [Pseudomonadales bacterium]
MQPSALRLRKRSNVLELDYSDTAFTLPAELLRVYSPSAEVRGHGPGQEVLQVGKRWVKLTEIEPVGHYGVKLHFDDGHGTGIYTWD